MKKTLLLNLALLVLYNTGYTQVINLTKTDFDTGLPKWNNQKYKIGDIDSDGDQDIIIQTSPSFAPSLFLNDGSGIFTTVNFPIPKSSEDIKYIDNIHLKDLDADGDLDIFNYFKTERLTFNNGAVIKHTYSTSIYLNDGTGTFTKHESSGLPYLEATSPNAQEEYGTEGFADVNKDGYIDIIAFGNVYINSGTANFTALGTNIFNELNIHNIEFLDVENDGDTDVIISGKNKTNNSNVLTLYLNDGSGSYSISPNTTNFEQFSVRTIDVTDTDNDGDMDILISGRHVKENEIDEQRNILYINDGNGQFTALTTLNIDQELVGENLFADLDNDGDQDLVIIGGDGITPGKVYENLGNNDFTHVSGVGGSYISNGVTEDFNGDNFMDVLIGGAFEKGTIYWNTSDNILSTPKYISNPLKVYPNPSNGTFYFNLDKEYLSGIKIYSVTGKLVYQENQLKGITKRNLTLPKGMYIAVINSKNNSESIKIIIEK